MQRLPLRHIFFRWDERLYHDLYFDYISIDWGNDRQSDSLHGNSRENWFPWSCSDIFYIHKISPTKSIANQSLSNHSPFVSSRIEKDRCVTRQNGCMGRETNSLRAQPVIVSSRKAPPHKGVKEALRDKTKSCCTGLTRRHKKIVIGFSIQNLHTVIRVCYW